MKDLVLYVHGKGGSASEAAFYRPLFPACEVLGLDYAAKTPWEAEAEFHAAAERLRGGFGQITLVANSIGAYFCMCAGLDAFLHRAYFISPVVDMERMIMDMMRLAGVTEAELREKGEIAVPFGEPLSWQYLQYVRSHSIRWNVPTEILYGEKDALMPMDTVKAFADTHAVGLTVMKNGEHWFHTDEQMRFLAAWLLRCETGPGNPETNPGG